MREDRRPLLRLLATVDDETFARFAIWASTLYVSIEQFQSAAADLREAAKTYLEAIRRGTR